MTRGRPGARLRHAAIAACGATALLAACAPPKRAPESAPLPVGAAPASALTGPRADATVYRVVPDASELRVLVYRGGPLARLGHNHVLVSRDLQGEVRVPPDEGAVQLELSFAVGALDLDEPGDRAREGPEFDTRPAPADVEGTRRNLEGPEVLDAARHPRISIRSLGATRGPDQWLVRADVELRGAVHRLEVPARVQRDGTRLVARGEFPLRQTTLGMTPFSVAMGALQVRDELTIRYVLTAERR